MSTFLEIKQDILRFFAKADPAVARLSIPSVTTATAGEATTLDDSELGFGTGQANKYDGREVEIVATVSSSPTEGDTSGVDDGGFNLTDSVTVSPGFDATPQTATNYLMYPLGLSKSIVEDAMNEVFRETQAPHLWRPSLIADSALDNAAVTDVWTEVGSLSTAIEYEAATDANVFLGARNIHGVADAAGEGWKSDAIPVTVGERILVSVFVRTAVGSVVVVFYNETASENIKAVTINEGHWTEVRFTDNVPLDCESVSLRILSAAASDDFYMGAHPVFQVTNRSRLYPVPTWLTTESQIESWVRFPLGINSEAADSFVAMGNVTDYEPAPHILRDERAQHPFYVELRLAFPDDPVGMFAQRDFAEITTGDATAHGTAVLADRQYVRTAAIAKILRDKDDPRANRWARFARSRADALDYGLRNISIEPTPTIGMGSGFFSSGRHQR